MNDKIRVGLLIDSFELPAWVVEMIKKIGSIDKVEIAAIIINSSFSKNSSARNDHHNSSLWSYRLYTKLDKLLYKVLPDASITKNLSEFAKNMPQLYVTTEVSQGKKIFTAADIDVIRSYRADVLIKLGFEDLDGEIFALSELGVWSLDCYKEKPEALAPGSMQFFCDQGITGSAVTLLSNDPAKEKILYQSFSMTDTKSLNRNQNKLYWKSLFFIPRLLSLLTRYGKNWFWDHVNKTAPSKTMSQVTVLTNGKIMRMLVKKTWMEIAGRIRSIAYTERWNLYFYRGAQDQIESSIDGFKKLACPNGAFWADPHVAQLENKTFIFFEEWDYKKRKGHISAIEFTNDGNNPVASKVLERPYHLSYPFVFKSNDTWYMIPETASNRTIEIYKAVEFPGKWSFVMNLMENVHAVDTTLYFHNDKWWLFANIVENAGASALDELFVFYADDFLTTDWKAHKLNPVVSDARSARPAGALFSIHQKIFRPSQCSDKIYGRSTNINEIITLSEDDFSEISRARLVPEGSDKIKGIHSYCKSGELTVIDMLS